MVFINNKWNKIYEGLLSGESVLLHCPKHCGKNFFFNYLVQDEKINARFNIIYLNLINDDSNISYEVLNKTIQTQVNSTHLLSGNDNASFIESLTTILSQKKCLFAIKITGENVRNSFNLINSLHNEMQNSPNLFAKNLTILVLDDYSLYFYQASIFGSRWDYFFRYCLGMIDDNDFTLGKFGNSLPEQAKNENFLNQILKITGGHEGLLNKSLNFFRENSNRKSKGWEVELKEFLWNSDIISSIGRDCSRKSKSFFEHLNEYKLKQFTDKNISDIIDAHKIGVVIKIKGPYSILCPGIIAELIQKIYYSLRDNDTYII